MKNVEKMYNELQYGLYQNNQKDNPCNGISNIRMMAHKKKVKIRKKHDVEKYNKQQVAARLSRFNKTKTRKVFTKHISMTDINKRTPLPKQTRSYEAINKKSYFNNKFVVNRIAANRYTEYLSPFNFPTKKKWKVYRCQLSARTEDTCCCNCNSDAMFEVMKSLYDCYKKKNCDNCNCVLCGHLPKEERSLGEERKYIETQSAKERKRTKVKEAERMLEGKTPEEKERILKELIKTGHPLPKGKTASEKALIKKLRAELKVPESKTTTMLEKIRKGKVSQATITTERLRRAKTFITTLEGKPPEQQERILREIAMQGHPLPEAKTASQKMLIEKVRADLGLPPEPKSSAMRKKYSKAADAGILQPLEGKTPQEKRRILQALHDRGIPLPEGRTSSEKALIAHIKAGPPPPSVTPSERLQRADAAGLLTPIDGKSPEEKERIIRGLAMQGLPLPEGKTSTDKRLIEKVRADLGLPPEPKSSSMKKKYARAADVGLLQPLEGKTAQEKKRILQGLHDRGIPLPEGRTASERALIAKIKAGPPPPSVTPSERLRRAEAAGLLTPLEGKPPEEQEKILRGLAMQGLPLPEGKTSSQKRLIEKVRADLGLPPEPKSSSMKKKYAKAADIGLLQPLEGKTAQEKKIILQGLHNRGIPLPEGRTASERALIAKIKAGPPPPSVTPSERLRRAEAAGLLTPLEGKPPEEQEKILRGLAMQGLPLPEGKTSSQKRLIEKVRADLGLPPEPKSSSMKKKYAKAADIGLLQPLEGKTAQEKKRILQGLHDRGIPLPEGRTASERALIAKIKAGPPPPSVTPSERLQRAEAAGLLTPLEGKPPEEQEKILKGLAMQGLPLPEGKTSSQKRLIEKVRADLGLPPEPKSSSMKKKYAKAADIGLLQPLEGKTAQEKKRILQGLHDRGIPLPEGRTASERALIAKIKAGPPPPSVTPSERLQRAEAAGLLTPLEGKPPEEQEKILRGLAMQGLPLPEGKTSSQKRLIEKVRADLGLPPEPKSSSMKKKYAKAADIGLLQPLEGKTAQEKKRILQGLHDRGIPLPEGRTASERALIAKIKAGPPPPSVTPSERLQRAEAAGLLTPLEGKPSEEQEKILRGLAMQGLPLPEGKTYSQKRLIEKVRADLGLPPEPKSSAMKDKYVRAANAGLMQPLEGKAPEEKKRILQGLYDRGIPLPEGRTSSEKALIAKIKAKAPPPSVTPSERVHRARAAGLLTPLEGKSPEQQERILKGLAMQGLPLPEGKTSAEKRLIDKVRADLGLPPEPKSSAMKEKYARAANAGLMQPLESKTPQEKRRILQGLYDRGIPLPEGRTSSERALIAQIKAGAPPPSVTPSERLKRAEAAGLLTPIEGKSPEEQERIVRGLAMQGLPIPEGKTSAEKRLIDKVRADLGLPPEPKSSSMKEKYARAADAGILQPLEGKTAQEKKKILKALHDRGIPLPEGRTASERALIAKIKAGPPPPSVTPSERLRRAEAAGLLTPLEGKSPELQEQILRGLAMQGLPLPEGKTSAEKRLIDKVRADLGLPPEPRTSAMKQKYARAANEGLLQPLEGKSPEEKKRILQGLYDRGIPLPEGRTSSERALIAKIKAAPPLPSVTPSERIQRAREAGLLTPLEGKSPEQQERILRGLALQGVALPEGKTSAEKRLIEKVRADLGLPPEPKSSSMKEKYARAADAGLMQPLEGKTPQEKRRILQDLHDRGIPLPEGRTSSEKALIAKVKAGERLPSVSPSERIQRARAAGLLTTLEGKPPDQKERILRGLAMQGLPLPEGKTASERRLIEKVRADLGLPPEPKSSSMKKKHAKAADAGLLQPLEGKTAQEKKRILQALHDRGIPLPEGRTASEKALIAKIKAGPPPPSVTPSERLFRAKEAGLLTPLEGKSPEQQERILRGLAMQGVPLPEAKTSAEKKLIDKVRADLGLPPEPKSSAMKQKYARAAEAGLMQPLEGKSHEEKKRILQGLHNRGIPLPEGRTSSERALIAKIKAKPPPPSVTPSERLQRARAAGLLTPLEGKSPEQQERILRGLAMQGVALPEGKTSAEKRLIEKVRADLGLSPEPKSSSMKEKYARAADAGLLQPLEGKTSQEKKRILQALHDRGIPLPEGRTSSERALIVKIKTEERPPSVTPSERIHRARAAGLLTTLEGKSPEQQEKILRGLAMQGLPLPVGKTGSEKKLIEKVRADLGLPPEPKSSSMKEKYARAADDGLLQPLEGKSRPEKERILQGLHDRGIPLPIGRTASEKSLIAKVKAGALITPSAKLRRAKAAGLLTPLEGKRPEQQERILKGLAMRGLPLPEGKTASEKRLIEKVRADLGLPPEPKSSSMKEKHAKAADYGLLQPLEGKTQQEKERILQGLHDRGIPLPEGRTASERSLIAKVKAGTLITPSAKLRKAKAAGLLTPLEGKTYSHKERILKGLAMEGLPLPEPKTYSEKKLAEKVRAELGLPPEPETLSMKEKYEKAAGAGLIQPLKGKTQKEKEKILQRLHDRGIPLPEGRTSSERALIAKIKAGERIPSVTPSERMHRARAAGLLTPLEGKSPEQQDRILRGLAMQGLPLPEAKTASEKRLIEKVRADLGLPPEPKSSSMKEKYGRAADAGLMQPLAGKSTPEKIRILQGLHNRGIPLPEGRTASEKSLIAKVKEGRIPYKVAPPSITTEKLKKAKAAGLLTPLEGKPPEQKEEILRGLARHGLPLPQGRTASEKSMIKRIKREYGIPERTPSEKMRKAKKTGLLTPLEGKTRSQKEKILRGRAAAGLPLPTGRTPSERALIEKIKRDTGYVSPTLTEKMKRAKDIGLLTPLEGKTRSAKEKIIRDRIAAGIPLPEGTTPTEKELIRKVVAAEPIMEKPASERLRQARTASEKEKVLKSLYKAGKPLPVGKTDSEKMLIAKIKAESRAPSKVTSEKLRNAKEAGLLTPLAGKSPKEKERILRGLINQGLPLPESQTESERKIAEKVRRELGLPPEPTTLSEKRKMHRAEAAGIVTPLEGKTSSHKERIVRGMVAAGIPLPEGRTASEKAMIKRVKDEGAKVSSKAAVGLLTPLAGKTPSQKERIIRGRAEAGIPLPEGKTSSERAMIQKVRAELGLPPPAKTASEREVVRKARAEGLLTPIAGKSSKEKERILRGLAEAGLPLPEGKTSSERDLIRKIRAEAGLPLEPTPSEKRGKIMTKTKKVGVTPSKQRVKTTVAGIGEQYEDILKTTTCDRACGCDKKKIRFKHSYVKIRVTSPDISSLCDCDYECIPGVKSGAFIDNDGIKVTVGRVDDVTSFTSQYSNYMLVKPKSIITLYDNILTDSYSSSTSTDTVDARVDKTRETTDFKRYLNDSCPTSRYPAYYGTLNNDHDTSCTFTISSYYSYTDDNINNKEHDKSDYLLESSTTENFNNDSDRFVDSSRYKELSEDIFNSLSNISHDSSMSSDSVLLIKSESSLSLITETSDSVDVTSVMSLWNSSLTSSSSTQIIYYTGSSSSPFSVGSDEGTESFTNRTNKTEIEESGDDATMSETDHLPSRTYVSREHPGNREFGQLYSRRNRNDYFVYTMSETKLSIKTSTHQIIQTTKINTGEPLVVVSNLDSGHDITTMVDNLLSNNEFSEASSLFVVVPTSDDNDSVYSSDGSTICIQLSKHYSKWNHKQSNNVEEPETSRKNSSTAQGLKISSKGKKYCMEGMMETSVGSFHQKKAVMHHAVPEILPSALKTKGKPKKHKICQISTPIQNIYKIHGVSTDTTSDRPCCCAPKSPRNENNMPECQHLSNPTSMLVNKGTNFGECSKLPKVNEAVQQASFMSNCKTPTTTNPCLIPPCVRPDRFLEPVDNSNSKSPQNCDEKENRDGEPCQCSPEKIREMFEQVLKGKAGHVKPPEPAVKPTERTWKTPGSANVEIITCNTDEDEDCGKCSHHNNQNGLTMTCACSGKKRTVKLHPLCPCELHEPPVSKTLTGPKAGTRSTGCQCCTCDDSSLVGGSKCKEGPGGGMCQMEAGGAYTQAGMKAELTTAEGKPRARKECVCKTKKKTRSLKSWRSGKKKKNITCECPPSEPESEPEPEPLTQPVTNPGLYEHQSYGHYQDYGEWTKQDLKEIERQALREKSDMAQTQSGFRMLKRKKPKPPVPPLEPEYTVEDAVRYYVSIKPSLIKGLFPEPGPDCPCNDDDDDEEYYDDRKNRGKKSKIQCECPPPTTSQVEAFAEGWAGGVGRGRAGVGPYAGVGALEKPPELEPEPEPESDQPSGGFKFSIGGKGSASKGLSGVCCFDMIQETQFPQSKNSDQEH